MANLKDLHITGRSAVDIFLRLRAAIETGEILPGVKLPTVRGLAEQLNVHRNTVSQAYRRLAQHGLVVSSARGGTSVAVRLDPDLIPDPDFGPGVRDLSLGNPDTAFFPDVSAAIKRAAGRPRPLYGGPPDVPELLDAIASLVRKDGVPAENISIVSGGFDGMERALSAHLGPGDSVAMEEPGFTQVTPMVRALGMVPVPMAMDTEGVLPDSLEAALKKGVRAVIVTPTAQNPTGATLTATRAADLAAILRRYSNTLLIEDDHYRMLTTSPAYSIAAHAPTDRRVLVRSFAKCFGPDIRLAVLIGDATTLLRVRQRMALGAQWVSHLLQWTVLELLNNSTAQKKLEKAGLVYNERRNALIEAFARNGITGYGVDGLFVWVPIARDTLISRHLLAKGWAVQTGDRFRIKEAYGLRITSAILDSGDAEKLAADLANAIRP